MILILHEGAHYVTEVWKGSHKMDFSVDLCKTFWDLAEKFPDELLVWVEKDLFPNLRKEKIEERFHHDLIMSSYAVNSKYLSGSIGYIDQLPFINVKRGVKFPTWRMSSDVGGITGKVLLQFRPLFKDIKNFEYLLNSVSKLGQQNGLFCYSDPSLINSDLENLPISTARTKDEFSFVYQHYKTIWVFILFFCFVKYERKFPLLVFLRSFGRRKVFKKEVDLSEIKISANSSDPEVPSSVDVIIPTLGRAEYVKQVVWDFSRQSLLPRKLIIVEQQPDIDLGSDLYDFSQKDWPFEIVHIFTRETGACMARNRALEKVKSQWIFFADDDIRIREQVLAETLKEAERLNVDCINLNCKQPGEETFFHKVKQWGSFGSGTSVVHSRFAENLRFSEVFEHGYGEDADFGMKLRQAGCDIIYHPNLEIQHLKAPIGGFRKKPVLDWEKENPSPKPSPTLMLLAKRYYSHRQMKGFKISLYLKFFRKQKENNPVTYYKRMERSWKKSEEWAERLVATIQTSRANAPK